MIAKLLFYISYVQIILSFLNEAVTSGTPCLLLQCDSFKINSNVLTYIINMRHQCYNLFLIIICHIHAVIIIGRFSPIVSCIIVVICASHVVWFSYFYRRLFFAEMIDLHRLPDPIIHRSYKKCFLHSNP